MYSLTVHAAIGYEPALSIPNVSLYLLKYPVSPFTLLIFLKIFIYFRIQVLNDGNISN